MTGIATVLQTTLTDASLPVIDLTDRLLTAGSLLLIDPTHSSSPWPAGVPANAAVLPNVAWKRANAMIGAGDASSLGVYFDDLHQAADAMFERTPKGGIHGIYSQVNNGNANRGAALRVQVAIRDYLYTNRAHRFYMSVWHRRTRAASIAGGALQRNAQIADATQGAQRQINFDPSETFGNTQTGFREAIVRNTVGVQMRSVDGSGYNTAAPAASANLCATAFQWGNYGIGQTAWANKSASDVFYRAYIEDLTVSGRTYAQVDALDYALWQAAFATGGRYIGDTFTDPATFA